MGLRRGARLRPRLAVERRLVLRGRRGPLARPTRAAAASPRQQASTAARAGGRAGFRGRPRTRGARSRWSRAAGRGLLIAGYWSRAWLKMEWGMGERVAGSPMKRERSATGWWRLGSPTLLRGPPVARPWSAGKEQLRLAGRPKRENCLWRSWERSRSGPACVHELSIRRVKQARGSLDRCPFPLTPSRFLMRCAQNRPFVTIATARRNPTEQRAKGRAQASHQLRPLGLDSLIDE